LFRSRLPRRDRVGHVSARVLRVLEHALAGLGRLLAGGRSFQSGSRLRAAERLPASGGPRVLHAAAEAMALDPPRLAARKLHVVLRVRRPAAELVDSRAILRYPAEGGRSLLSMVRELEVAAAESVS